MCQAYTELARPAGGNDHNDDDGGQDQGGVAHSQVRLPFSALLATGPLLLRIVCMMSLFSSSPNSGRVEISSSPTSIPEWGAVWGVGVADWKNRLLVS